MASGPARRRNPSRTHATARQERLRRGGTRGNVGWRVKFFWLNFHLPYACRHSGVCCTSGWPIPVEAARVAAIEGRIARNVIPLRAESWMVASAGLPEDVTGTLAMRDDAHCIFFEAGGSGCAIHDVKPASCDHFPFVCLIDARGAHVTLSHYCPTAASLLFEPQGPIEIVEGPSPLPDVAVPEGLDARDALPPLQRGMTEKLMAWEDVDAWQRDRVLTARIDELQPDDVPLFDRARAAVAAPLSWPEAPGNVESLFFAMVAPSWPHFEDVLTRYAAAKAHASWSLYLGNGIDAAEQAARIAHAVLRVECARQCGASARRLDRELLMNAIRQTDLLLVHYADPETLARQRA